MNQEKNIILKVDQENVEKRLDVYLFDIFKQYSRTFFKNLILNESKVFVNDKLVQKPSYLTRLDDKIEFSFKDKDNFLVSDFNNYENNLSKLKCLDVKVLYSHEDFLIIYKPAYLNTHRPNDKSQDIALTDWLIMHFKELSDVGCSDRPGIVHRLDKDTSGLLIVPRNTQSHIIFSDMFKNRQIEKTYIAIVSGNPKESGEINLRIKRHNIIRTKMSTDKFVGRESLTNYKVINYLKNNAILEVKPFTGRTHQIRVHLSSINHPIIGDLLYGVKSNLISRQALHAYKLTFTYKDHYFMFLYDLPSDIQQLIKQLELD